MLRRFLLSVVCLFTPLAVSAQNWTEVRAPGFIVNTEAGEKRGKEIGLRFEQMRRLYATLLPREQMVPVPAVQVIAFKSVVTMRSALPTFQSKPLATDALWVPADDRFYAVIDAGNEGGWNSIFREYARMVLVRNLPRTPQWFDEGFVDYFGAVTTNDKDFLLGKPIPEYEAALRRGLVPMEQFLQETHLPFDSAPEERRTALHAQAWLMVHYLFHADKIEAATDYFVATMSDGLTPAAALERAFGMTPAQFGEVLRKHLADQPNRVQTHPLPAGLEPVMFASAGMKEYLWRTLLADVQLYAGDADRAIATLQQVVSAEPLSAGARAVLGAALFRKGDHKAAWEHLRKALELDSTDARASFLAAQFQWERRTSDIDAELLVSINEDLDRAIRLSQSYVPAMELKAQALALATNTAEAIRTLRTAIRLQPRNERLQVELGQLLRLTKRFDDADAIWARLRRSPDPAIVAQAEQEARMTETWRKDPLAQLKNESEARFASGKWRRPEETPKEDDDELEKLQAERDKPIKKDLRKVLNTKGLLTGSVCDPKGPVTLQVTIGAKKWRFKAPALHSFVVIGADEFDCTWTNLKVTVNYKQSGPSEGDLVSIELP
ncbi:MAG: tetratricopeptide repeat protein [Acidobacteriales bacterium]|nr:tetratricopeptide repeat protein [Terriglobales bacterium]